MPAKFRAPKRCKKANVFPCKGECVPRRHWKTGTEQRCRNVATGTPATYLEWLKQQTRVLKIENTRRSKRGEALAEMDQAGYVKERSLDRRLQLSKSPKALTNKELDQAIKSLAKNGGTLELKRALFAEKKRRQPTAKAKPPIATPAPSTPQKPQTPQQSIQLKITQARNVEEAFRSFSDEELKLASKIFTEKNVGVASPYKRKLAAELRRRTTEKPESNVTPIAKPKPSPSPKVVSIDQGRPKMPAPKDYKDAIANGQKFLGKDYEELQKLGREYFALSKRLDPRTASQSVIAQTEKRLTAIADQTSGIIRKLIDKSSVSQADAEKMLGELKLPKTLDDGDRQAITDFLRFSNGQAMEVLKQVQYTTGRRGQARTGQGIVEIRRGQPKSIWHELGHMVEFTQQNQKTAIGQAFIKARATGKARPLSEVNPKYSKTEKYLPDDFVTPYVGKIYKAGTTEVFSMGIDAMSDPKRMLNLAFKDPEHLALSVGVFQQDYAKPSNVVPMRKQQQAAEVIGEDLPTPTEEQLRFRQKWLDDIDPDDEMSPDEYQAFMDDDLDKWIEYADEKGWDAEAIDIALGYA